MEDGLGNLYLEFEKLKKKLEQEGLFKKEYKKKMDAFKERKNKQNPPATPQNQSYKSTEPIIFEKRAWLMTPLSKYKK